MLLIGVLLFYEVSLRNISLLSREWLRVVYALSPTLFFIYINGLLCEIEKARSWVLKFRNIQCPFFCLPMIL